MAAIRYLSLTAAATLDSVLLLSLGIPVHFVLRTVDWQPPVSDCRRACICQCEDVHFGDRCALLS